MKRKYIILAILIIFGVPIIISELYKLNRGYMTPWGAEDTLAYAATVISAVATFVLGWIAIIQNKKANAISDRLLRLEEVNAVPSICVVEDECGFVEYSENSIHLKLIIKNLSSGIVEIKQISNIQFHIMQTGKSETLRFASGCLEYSDLLPGQKKQLDFSIDSHNEVLTLCDAKTIKKLNLCPVISGDFNIVLGYKESEILYKENIRVVMNQIFHMFSSPYLNEGKITRIDYSIKAFENTDL